MIFNLDVAIFVGFLIMNLIIGILSSRGITNIKEYAVGDRNFSTGTIVATIVATCIGGGFFSGAITESYKQGLYFIIPAMGEPLALVIVGYYLVPRMAEFLGTLSVAEAMGSMYGTVVRVITAVATIILCVGIVALQFKVTASVLQIFFGVPGFYATLVSAIIVVFYSAFGGIKAVSFTDIIQFFTFGTIIPIITLIIWGTFNDPYQSFVTISQSPLFNPSEVFDVSNPKFLSSLFLLGFFLIPEIQPVYFQRIVMASNVKQARTAFIIAGIVCLLMLLIIVWVGVLLLSNNANLDPNNLLAYIINNYSYPGLKGLTAIGVMSVVMSTADSYINTASVTFSNDIVKPLFPKLNITPLLLSKFFAVIIGVFAFFLAFKASTILELLLMIFSFYAPIVSAPLLLALFGFRSTTTSALIGISAGTISVIILNLYDSELENAIVDIGMLANIIFLVGSHYLLRQEGGWVGIKDDSLVKELRESRRKSINQFFYNFQRFNFFAFCKNNAPKQEYTYSLFGLFCIISVFSTMYSIPREVLLRQSQIIELIYHTVLISSTILLTYPIWPATFKKERFIIFAWNILVPYTLIFAPTLLVIISNFGQFQLMIFLLNMVIIGLLFRWQMALVMIILSVFFSAEFYKWYIGVDNINSAIDISLQFKIMYTLLLFSSILIAFIKPKQEQYALTEEKNDHLSDRIEVQESELRHALALKKEFIRNVTHEYNTPMTGIISMAEVAYAYRNSLSKEELAETINTIYKSALRLNNFDSNISTLAKLSKAGVELHKEKIDFSILVHERVEICRKLYKEKEDNEAMEFVFNIANGIEVFADRYYLTQTLDNLIINAITYCKKGNITVELECNKEVGEVKFSIIDEGIGIPRNELYDIFDEFKVGSKTHTPAGGRGVGLAVAKKVIEAHGGIIKADSDGKKGARFWFVLSV